MFRYFYKTFSHTLVIPIQIILMSSLNSSTATFSNPGPRIFHKFRNVIGFNNNCNDILFGGFTGKWPTSNIVFFGGDIQDFEETMRNREFLKWNLDFTARILADKFPSSFIWIVKPSEMEDSTFSIYKNFVTSTNYGIPLHKPNQKSWVHLYSLIKTAIDKMITDNSLNLNLDFNHSSIIDLPLTLIGFSKGCIVLNQLLFDLNNLDIISNEYQQFINRLNKIYWLDGGHAGSSQTWITDAKILKPLVSRNIQIEVHVTPFQISNQHKVVVGKEYKIFLQNLKDLNASVVNKVYYADQPPSIENHFSLLLSFH